MQLEHKTALHYYLRVSTISSIPSIQLLYGVVGLANPHLEVSKASERLCGVAVRILRLSPVLETYRVSRCCEEPLFQAGDISFLKLILNLIITELQASNVPCRTSLCTKFRIKFP